MQTQVLQPTQENLQLAAAIFRSGGLVGMPTETVYGLGANALDQNAALAIFAAKGRPADNPLIVHISALDQLDNVVSAVPDCAKKLMDAFWPGPLTLIMPKHERIPLEVTAGLPTVAVRFPVHPVARKMIDLAGLPIAAPSANLSGRPSPTTAQHVLDDLNDRIPLIIDGGPCQVGLESTVVDTTWERAVLLRPGGVMSLCIYYGRNNGYGERDAILDYVRTLDHRLYTVMVVDFANRIHDPPIPVFIVKEG